MKKALELLAGTTKITSTRDRFTYNLPEGVTFSPEAIRLVSEEVKDGAHHLHQDLSFEKERRSVDFTARLILGDHHPEVYLYPINRDDHNAVHFTLRKIPYKISSLSFRYLPHLGAWRRHDFNMFRVDTQFSDARARISDAVLDHVEKVVLESGIIERLMTPANIQKTIESHQQFILRSLYSSMLIHIQGEIRRAEKEAANLDALTEVYREKGLIK